MAQLPPSLPPSHPYRHLGTSGADPSVRIQMIITLILGLVMIAVPLYLWRRPKAEASTDAPPKKPAAEPSARPASSADVFSPGNIGTSQPPKVSGILLSEPKMLKCSKGSGKGNPRVPAEQCDRQPYFEEALIKAIQENVSCAPQQPGGGTINFVLDVDHKTHKLHAWAGKSGSMKKAPRKKVLACVNKALPTPDWSQIPHLHQRYQISAMATYP